MAGDQDKSSRTEAPSKHKLKKSREEGQVAKSQDLSASVVLTVAIIMVAFSLGRMGEDLNFLWNRILFNLAASEISENGFNTVFMEIILRFVIMIAPLLFAIMIGAFAATVAQVGLKVTFKPLIPKFDKINPINGFQRLFSMRSLIQTLMALIKMIFVSFVAGSVIWNNRDVVAAMAIQDLELVIARSGWLTWELSIKAAVTLLILAIVDFGYQKWQHLEDQKMSKRELKEEYKEHEGDPAIKAKIRSRQRAASQRRGLKESVSTADVVVTNPFHIAVALKYDREISDSAPIVVAKGARLLAERIKEFAAENEIEIIQNIPLARALYKNCQVDMEISPDLYIAVAEILAMVYSKKRTN
jgi:flagellar biosynthesis protein FlhB